MTQHAGLIERLNDLSNWSESLDCEIMREAAQTLEALEREVEVLRKKAARYDWLRDRHWVEPEATFRLGLGDCEDSGTYHRELDQAIDAAIQHEGASNAGS